MKLSEAIAGTGAVAVGGPEPAAVEVTGVVTDSRQAGPGMVFVAIVGTASDGHRFAADAVRAGAQAVVLEREVPGLDPATVLRVADARAAVARIAANLHHRPGERLPLVGVTGTNGKTTVAHLVEATLLSAGKRPGVIGTVEHRWGETREVAAHTTPGPEVLQGLLARMRDDDVDVAVLEVSSHALDQQRVLGCRFRVAAFTGLSRDHLDYHPDLEAYFEAKARLFTEHLAPDGIAVVSLDDTWGRLLSARLIGLGVEVVGTTVAPAYGEPAPAGDRLLMARSVRSTLDGLAARVALPDGDELELDARVVGRHNLANLLTATGICRALGLSNEDIRRAIAPWGGAPGRLERVEDPSGRHLFVDYAHTPDALERVVRTLRELAPESARVVVVFGCGGDRDRGKRPLMARATAAADLVVVTSDNPRSEDPDAIIAEILPGLPAGKDHRVETDRARAIETAVGLAAPGDVVLLAGKGHESYQLIGGERRHFDDREVAAEAMRRVAPGTRSD